MFKWGAVMHRGSGSETFERHYESATEPVCNCVVRDRWVGNEMAVRGRYFFLSL